MPPGLAARGKRHGQALKDEGTQTPVLFAMKRRRGEEEKLRENESGAAIKPVSGGAPSLLGLTPLRPNEAEEALGSVARRGGSFAGATGPAGLLVPGIDDFRALKEPDRQALLGRLGSALQLLLEVHRDDT